MSAPISNNGRMFPRYSCFANFTAAGGYAREWDYQGASILIDSSDISKNSVGTTTSSD